jgi:hypothetical protein
MLLTAFTIGILFNYFFLRYTENEISKSGIGKLKVSKNITGMIVDSANKNAVKLSLHQYINPNLLLSIRNLGDPGDWEGKLGIIKNTGCI